MHPAPSLIAFTTLSGLGLGLLIMLGLGLAPSTGRVGLSFFGLAFALALAGLLASTAHLGHPERALKAFTQWRSSWLSREAWLSAASLGVMALFAGLTLQGLSVAPLGWLGAGLCAATVGATAMIYTQLRTVPRWHHWSTPALFLCHSVAGGTLLAGHTLAAVLLLLATGLAQLLSWRAADHRYAAAGSSVGSATGLGGNGHVRLFEAPHTGGNYLTREMVFVIGRKHAAKLRVVSALLAFVLPALLMALSPGHVLAALAVLSHLAGVLVGRWLFFAEAEHVVGLYYGRPPLSAPGETR